MSEFQNQHGRREAPGGGSAPGRWWADHRAWVAGLNRGQRVRYRLFQFLVVLSILIIGVTLFLRSWIQLPEVPNLPGTNTGPGGTTSQLQPGQTGSLSYEGAQLPDVMLSGRKDGYYTFLLAGRDTTSGLTDTIILITYDTKGQNITAISLLRDTMVNTTGKTGGQKRLNAVYTRNLGDKDLSDRERTENGMTALKQEVSKLTGIYPDFYVLVEWEAIGRLVDAIGGVEFEVPFLMDYRDPYQDLVIYQEPGLRLLDGEDAMQVIRFRKNSDGTHVLGDAGRTQIQRDFLTAALKKCLTPEILLRVPALAQIFTENVSTDLTVGNILAFAQLAVGMEVEENVRFVSMPFDNTSYRGAALVVARQDELLELLNDGINPYQEAIGDDDLQLMYRKRGGGFGVTNASLLDPAVGQAPAPSQPSQDSPDSSQAPDDPSGGQDNPDPDETDTPPGGIGSIDPSDIFPDPSPDIQGGGSGELDLPPEETTQAVA